MSKINKISVDGISYDIEDKSVPSWAKSSAKPTYKTSELENDSNFITETKVDEKIANVAVGGGGEIKGEVMPIGTMIPFGSATNIPSNWRICDGSEVSRETYADLFAVIGTSYGEGDGETTFNLPNKKGRVSVGYDIEQTQFNEIGLKGGSKFLQEHNHINTGFDGRVANWSYGQGIDRWKLTTSASESGYTIANLDSAGVGDSENLQPYEVDVWIIKTSNVIGNIEKVDGTIIDNLTSTSSTDALSANMGRELNEKLENSLNQAKQVYSLEEKVVGTWHNNKPIYRKVIITTTPATANQWADIDTGIENIDEHISKNISYKVNTLTYFADAYENSTYRFLAVLNGNKVSVLVGVSSWCSKPMTMVLEYTKTTD